MAGFSEPQRVTQIALDVIQERQPTQKATYVWRAQKLSEMKASRKAFAGTIQPPLWHSTFPYELYWSVLDKWGSTKLQKLCVQGLVS